MQKESVARGYLKVVRSITSVISERAYDATAGAMASEGSELVGNPEVKMLVENLPVIVDFMFVQKLCFTLVSFVATGLGVRGARVLKLFREMTTLGEGVRSLILTIFKFYEY